jgi:hypothetical protein
MKRSGTVAIKKRTFFGAQVAEYLLQFARKFWQELAALTHAHFRS